MKTQQITIRKVDPLLKQRIKRSAKLSSQSINDWVLDAIRAKAGQATAGGTKEPSWKSLRGSFSTDAIDEKSLEAFDQISPDMWK